MLAKLLLMSKNQKMANGKKSFKKFFTAVKIEVEGEEEKGLQSKTMTVKFDSSIDTKDFTRGILTVDMKDVDIPFRYRIKEVVSEDGSTKKVYPHIFIKKVIKYEERKPKSTAVFDLLDEEEDEEEFNIEDEVTEDDEDK